MSRFDFTRFKQPPDEEFLCGICKNVLDDPKESPCRHVFCKACITRALQEKPRCPICRKRLRERRLKDVLPLVQNLLNKLQMECDHSANGCQASISLEAYITHIANCDFMMVPCKNEFCDDKFLKRDSEIHQCRFKTFVCDKGCECKVLCGDKDSHSCVQTLRQKNKEATEKIEQLENKVKELEAAAASAASASNNRSRNNDSLSLSPSGYSDLSLSVSSFSYHYSNSPFPSSISDSGGNLDPPVMSEDEEDYGGWPFTSRRRQGVENSGVADNNNIDNIGGSSVNRNNNNDDGGGSSRGVVSEENIQSSDRDGGDRPWPDYGRPFRNLINRISPLDRLDVGGELGDLGEATNVVDESSDSINYLSDMSSVLNGDHDEISSSRERLVGGSNEEAGGSDAGLTLSTSYNNSRKRAAGSGVSHPMVKRSRRLRDNGVGGGGEQSTSRGNALVVEDGGVVNSEGDGDTDNTYENGSSSLALRRSARLQNLPAEPVNEPEDVPLPLSSLYDLYAENGSSSDESWVPDPDSQA